MTEQTTIAPEQDERRPLTLKEAAARYDFTVSTLKAEAKRCHLTVYKIGKRLYTTPSDIREMVRLCRVEQKAPGFTLNREAGSGSSETARISCALDAANLTAQTLKNSSRNTSPLSISPRRQARR